MVEAVVLQYPDGGGAELGEPPDLRVDEFPPGTQRNSAAAAGMDVEVEAVLDRLAFRHDLEPDARPAAGRVDDAVLADPELLFRQAPVAPVVVPGGEAAGRRFELVVQRRGPEAR